MIEISKNEKDYLVSHGCYWHYDIMAPLSRAHYYARECKKVLTLLKQYKDEQIKKAN